MLLLFNLIFTVFLILFVVIIFNESSQDYANELSSVILVVRNKRVCDCMSKGKELMSVLSQYYWLHWLFIPQFWFLRPTKEIIVNSIHRICFNDGKCTKWMGHLLVIIRPIQCSSTNFIIAHQFSIRSIENLNRLYLRGVLLEVYRQDDNLIIIPADLWPTKTFIRLKLIYLEYFPVLSRHWPHTLSS